MKPLYLLLLVGVIFTFIAANALNNQQTPQGSSSTKSPGQGTMPSNEMILKTIGTPDITIVGKLKVSDNEYNVYYSGRSEISYKPYILLHLDNGIWLLNSPGYWIKKIQ